MAVFCISADDKREEVQLADVKVSIAYGRAKITLVLDYPDVTAGRFLGDLKELEGVRKAQSDGFSKPFPKD